MKQYYITSENIKKDDSHSDCYISPDDPIHELKITSFMGGLGAEARLAEYRAKIVEASKVNILEVNKPKINLWINNKGKR